MPRFGEAREDGLVFRGYRKTPSGERVPHYVSAEALERRKTASSVHNKERWLRTRNDPAAHAAYNAAAAQYGREDRRKRPEVAMWRSAKARARALGYPFSITPADIVIPTHCPVFGTLLVVGGGNIDDAPALDRIENDGGYTPGNVVVVSHRANRMKGDATVQELIRLAAFYSAIEPSPRGSDRPDS